MPEISRFLGIVIGIFPREHPPPYFHAVCGDYQITVGIESGIVHGDFPKRALRLVLEWLDLVLILAMFAVAPASIMPRAQQSRAMQVTWDFDNLNRIGGFPVRVEGAPKVVSSPVGSAIEFDGKQDALFIDHHPLAGAKAFTWEVIFRPDGGAEAQRWFHLAERDRQTGELFKMTGGGPTGRQDSNPRLLFELRITTGGNWYLDAFTPGRVLMFPDKVHPTGRWYHVAQVYDGKMFRSYVNGELQGEGPLDYKPQGEGAASIGARMNKVDYFHGAVAKARFTFEALTPAEFMLLPKQ